MLARALVRIGTVLLTLSSLTVAWAMPQPGDATAPVELPNFASWEAERVSDWCENEGLELKFYASDSGSPVSTEPMLNLVKANQSNSPAGTQVSPGDEVGVVLEPQEVEDFTGATVRYVRGWCEDYGMIPRFKRKGGGVIANPGNHVFIYANETTGEVPVGGTVGVFLSGPYLTIQNAYYLAAFVLIGAVIISVVVTRLLNKRR